ncbi:MAG: hypothetical protein ABII00_16635 [Elusimicrobiota bacterium]
MRDAEETRSLLARREYRALKDRLCARGDCERLAGVWPELEPLEKIAVFKLLAPERAMGFFGSRSFGDKYLLFSAYDVNSIAPLLEDLPDRTRALFEPLPDGSYERMLEVLEAEARLAAGKP